jgi:hypothetical protein
MTSAVLKDLFQKLAYATHALAGSMVDPEVKRLLLEIAVNYDRLAELAQPTFPLSLHGRQTDGYPSRRVAVRRQKIPRQRNHYH